ILFIHFLLRDKGFKVINLGRNISIDDVYQACQIKHPDYIFTLINEGLVKIPLKDYVEKLSVHCRTSKILLSGLQISRQQIKSRKNYLVFDSLDEILVFLDNL
ncbi:MAG: helix-turn-helix-type transcriptional regulator, partial [Saprospiraceae bacterium]|nr:helix-turn-helix-type transcriptional regulator [Saprospiraceae bacterium]